MMEPSASGFCLKDGNCNTQYCENVTCLLHGCVLLPPMPCSEEREHGLHVRKVHSSLPCIVHTSVRLILRYLTGFDVHLDQISNC
jgi:hypothetical protein